MKQEAQKLVFQGEKKQKQESRNNQFNRKSRGNILESRIKRIREKIKKSRKTIEEI